MNDEYQTIFRSRILARSRLPSDCDVPEKLRPWVTRLLRLRRQAGDAATLPKSLRKPVTRLQREAREEKYLRRRIETGNATDGMRSRLAWLQQRPKSAVEVPDQVLRKAQESFLTAAFRGLDKVLTKATKGVWRSAIGCVPAGIPPARIESYAYWILHMDDDEKCILREVFHGWSRHAKDYKRYLPANWNWLKRARGRGLDVAVWLDPSSLITVAGQRTIRIEVVRNPFEVFLMGEYFDTCLGFGGCNEMSPLANAHDANKQVIFVYDERGRVLARQIVAVSSADQMLCYNCYANLPSAQSAARDAIINAVATWCGRWAFRIGIPLADQGEPDEITKDLWYDDGELDWSDNAKKAWDDAARSHDDHEAWSESPVEYNSEPVMASI